MPVETAAPAVSAPPAGGGGESSAPVSTPSSTPASTPESTGAPVATPAAAPAAAPPAAPERPVRLAEESDAEFLKRFTEWKQQQQPAAEKPPEAKPEEKPPEAKPEEKKEEAKPGEEVKPGEEKPPAEPLLAEDELTLDEVGLPDVKQVNEAFKAAFDEHPELRGPLNKALRLAKQAAPVLQLIPDEATAQFAIENASIYSELQDQFAHIDTPDAGKSFLSKLADMSVVRDEKGNPVLENGQPVLHESFGNFGMAVFTDVADFMRSKYETLAKQGDENAQSVIAALDVITGVLSPSPGATDGEEVPEHVKQREAELQRQETQLRQQRQQAEQQRVEQWNDTLEEEVNDAFGGMVEEVLSKITVPDFNRDYVAAEIATGIAQKVLSNPLFQAQRRHLLQQGYSDQTRQHYVALTRRYAREVLMDVARPLLTKAGGQIQKAAQARQERQASQEAQSRTEPKGGTAPPIPVAAPTTGGKLQSFRDEYLKKRGERPSDREEVQFMTGKFKWDT